MSTLSIVCRPPQDVDVLAVLGRPRPGTLPERPRLKNSQTLTSLPGPFSGRHRPRPRHIPITGSPRPRTAGREPSRPADPRMTNKFKEQNKPSMIVAVSKHR